MKGLLTTLLSVVAFTGLAGTFYIDFAAGDDANTGTATNAAWQHCPGDAAATGNAASAVPAAGDVFQFRSGVRYYSTGIAWNWSGATNNAITLKGTGWGSGKAILDFGSLFTNTWTQCTSADQVFGNTNYAQIWFANSVSTQTSLHTVIVSNTFLPFSQDPNPESPILFDVVTTWRTTAQTNMSTNTLADAAFLTQASADYWPGAYLAFHHSPNSVSIKSITAFDPDTDTLTFSTPVSASTDFYSPTPYAVLGHPSLIDYAGEYCVFTNRFFLWPPGGADPNTLTIRLGSIADCLGVAVMGESFVTVDGFQVTGSFGNTTTTYSGGAIGNSGSSAYYGLRILNCDVSNCRSISQGGVLGFDLGTGNDGVVSGNSVKGCLRSRGSLFHGGNIHVRSNSWVDIGGTCIYFAGVTTGTISSNRLQGVRGTHGNGISVYQGSSNVTVERNVLVECGGPITYEASSNVYFYNNTVDCSYGGVDEWAGMSGTVRWVNNTIVNHGIHMAVNVDKSSSTAIYELRNNIIDGFTWQHEEAGRIYRSHNVWVGCPTGYGCPTMLTGESTNSLAALVVNATNDWRLLAESPAIGVGTNLNAYFTSDALGATRGATWDIGAYQYNETPTGLVIENLHVETLTVGQ